MKKDQNEDHKTYDNKFCVRFECPSCLCEIANKSAFNKIKCPLCDNSFCKICREVFNDPIDIIYHFLYRPCFASGTIEVYYKLEYRCPIFSNNESKIKRN